MQSITDSDFDTKVLKSATPVFVDFWAPWCGPCKMSAPVLEELEKEYSGKITFLKVNVDENTASSSKFQILSIPTTILFKAGQEIGRQVGFSGKNGFEDLLKKGL